LFLRTVRVKKGNRTYNYLKLVESVRRKNKVVQKILVNFGNVNHWPPEKLKKLSDDLALLSGLSPKSGLTEDDVDPQSSLDYGSFLLADCIWRRLELSAFLQRAIVDRLFEFEVEMALKVMVFNRLTRPSSKLALQEWIKDQYIPGVSPQRLKVHHYYRAMDILEEEKEGLEQWVFSRITDLFNLDLSLVFYDSPSSYFEGSGPPLASWGYSRDHRPDCRQIQIGLLVNRDGIPISHILFDGARSDQKTLPDIVKGLRKRFHIGECIFIADDGILNRKTVPLLKGSGLKSIWSTGMRKEKYAQEVISSLPKPMGKSWQRIKENLWVYELPERIAGQRIVVAFNPQRRKAQRKRRKEKIQESLKYLASFNEHTKRGARKNREKTERQIDRWLRSKGIRKYFVFKRKGPYNLEYHLDKGVLARQNSLDGMMILHTDAEKLSTEDIARGYRTLTQVEDAFNEIKNFIELRPIRHHTDCRVKAHVAICVIAYLIESLLDKAFDWADMELTARKALELLAPLKVVQIDLAGKRLKKTTQPTQTQLKLLEVAGLDEFRRIIE
jgi:transposase